MIEIQGGPFNNSFDLLQLHAHWGHKNNNGSEHLIDGESYAAEVFQIFVIKLNLK
jgi:hypothetical protein